MNAPYDNRTLKGSKGKNCFLRVIPQAHFALEKERQQSVIIKFYTKGNLIFTHESKMESSSSHGAHGVIEHAERQLAIKSIKSSKIAREEV